MRNLTTQVNGFRIGGSDPKLKVSFGLMLVAVLLSLTFLLYAEGTFDSFNYLFLLPWIVALLLVLAVPITIFASRSGRGFDSPLMITTVTYFIPAFVFGGLSLAIGWSDPYYLDFVQDPAFTLPYTIVLIMLGYSGLALGFFLPIGKRLGAIMSDYLPQREHTPRSYVFPGLLLLGFGLLSSVYALFVGVIGYQRGDEIGMFDGIIFLSTLFQTQGSFILWWILFKETKFTARSWMIVVLLVASTIVTALLAGNRGALLSGGSICFLAFLLSGRRFTMRSVVLAFGLLLAALVAGMIYGSAFRAVKGSEAKTGVDQYASNIGTTLSNIASGSEFNRLEFGLTNLAQRLDILSSLAVVVSNHEQLAPYEESYGIDNNIVKDLTYFMIPRVIWKEKPVASDARAYSALYFEYGDNSFAITPIGDLLRNFGVTGIFFGMLLLGITLRFIYRTLVEDQPPNLLRATLYLMLITSVSFEGFYGSILPMLLKVGITALVGLVFVEVIASHFSPRRGQLRVSGRLSPFTQI